tara:strand:+ start:236 stop:1204 length:969 start_codon:yes stop_codon:yes gene_type:complete
MIFRKKHAPAHDKPSKELVDLAYRLFLERVPTPREVEKTLERHDSLQDMRAHFLRSAEFQNNLGRLAQPSARGKEVGNRLLVHIHMPKTAGRTLNHLLRERFGQDHSSLLSDADLRNIHLTSKTDRQAMRFLYGHISRSVLYEIEHHFPQGCFYITLLREPRSRLLSLYRYIQRTKSHPMHSEVTAREMSFGQFLEHSAQVKDPLQEVDNGQMRRVANKRFPPDRRDLMPILFRQALHNMFADNMLYGLTEYFDDFQEQLVNNAILPQSEEARLNSAPEPTKINSVLQDLTDAQKGLLEDFTSWDTEFYEICKAAYLAEHQP